MDEHGNKVWTYDDLASLPEDGNRYEIPDGELCVSPSPSSVHQLVLKRLVAAFLELEKTRVGVLYFAPLDVILSPTGVVQPDLLFVRRERRAIISKRGVEAAPDLAIEVISPSNSKHDRARKRRFYARNGIREFWLVDPSSCTIDVLELVEGGLTYRSAGWYGPGDRARSVQFDLDLAIDELFAEDYDERPA